MKTVLSLEDVVNNISLSKKLLLISVVSTLMTMVLLAVAYTALNHTDNVLEEVARVRLPSLVGLYMMETGQSGLQKIERTLLVSELNNDREIAYQEKRIQQMSTLMREGRRLYEPLPQTPEEARVWKEFLPVWTEWLDSNHAVLSLIKKGDRKAAMELSTGKARQSVRKFEDLLGEIIRINRRAADDTTRVALPLAERRKTELAVIAALCALISMSVAFWISRHIAKSVGKTVEYSKAVANGFLNEKLDIHQRDEIGALADCLRAMVKTMAEQLTFSQGVMRGVAAPFSVFSAQDATLYTNQAMLDLMEIPGTPEAQVGKQSGEFIYGVKGKETLTTQALRERRALMREASVASRTGKIRHVHVSSAPFFDDTGELLGSVSVWLDQTAAVEAKTQAERAKTEGMLQAARHIEGVVDVTTSASRELSAQVEQSSRGAQEQAVRVGETATAMEQMNATVLEVARNAAQAAEMSDTAREKAQQGERIVDQMVRGIGLVQSQSRDLRTHMDALGKQADGIGQVMSVISDIADQTNLLALNAAIEAARAGEAGRGFAVVADEVRKLAEKTMQATKEVGQAIHGIQEETRRNVHNVDASVTTIEEATGLAQQAGESLKHIVSLVDKATDQVRSIAAASEQQSAASEQINRSIEEVATISTQTAQAMEQASQAVHELARQSQALQSLVVDMKRDGGGETGREQEGARMLAER